MPPADLLLAPFDLLVVKQVSEWTQQEAVTVEGEVKFPGVYPIKRGETMRSLIERAGGLTAMAYPAGQPVHARVPERTRARADPGAHGPHAAGSQFVGAAIGAVGRADGVAGC